MGGGALRFLHCGSPPPLRLSYPMSLNHTGYTGDTTRWRTAPGDPENAQYHSYTGPSHS